MQATYETTISTSQEFDLDEAVYFLAVSVARLSSGALSQLRRGSLTGAGSAAFWRLIAQLDHQLQPSQEEGYRVLIQCIAILTPKSSNAADRAMHVEIAHTQGVPFGRAMRNARISELRLAHLLNAPLNMKRKLAIRLCRHLVAANCAQLDMRTLARLVLYGSEPANYQIAREYFRAKNYEEIDAQVDAEVVKVAEVAVP